MKKFISFSKKANWFEYVVNGSTIVALVLQCIRIPEPFDSFIPYIAWTAIAMSVICIIIDGINQKKKNVLNRRNLITITQKLMGNSTGKVVMFGGDLSWAEDYISIISHLTNNNQTVEIIFPLKKIENAKRSVTVRFDKNIKRLKEAGAIVYCTEKDYYLRCTLVDVDSNRNNSEMKIISSKRISTNMNNENRNKYKTYLFDNSKDSDKILCGSFYQNYELIRQLCTEY